MTKTEMVKKVREITGLGIMEVRQALEVSGWDCDKATQYAKTRAKPSNKPTAAQAIFSYVHHNRQLGALISLGCATDFVSLSDDFRELGHKLAMHAAAMKPADIAEMKSQPLVTDPGTTVGELLDSCSAVYNEPVVINEVLILG